MSTFACCGFVAGARMPTTLDARVDQKTIGTLYDRIAPIYDLWGKLTESRARERAIELAEITNGQTILEVAVGTGLAFREIVERNPAGINRGIDLSEGMLGKARKRLRDLPGSTYDLQVGSAFQLDVPDESVDLLVNNYMFDLIPFGDMDDVLREFKRVLKRDGKLILVNMTEGERFGSGIYDRIYRLSPRAMGGCRGVTLAARLEDQGFRVVTREYHQQMLFPSEVILAKKSQDAQVAARSV